MKIKSKLTTGNKGKELKRKNRKKVTKKKVRCVLTISKEPIENELTDKNE